MNGSAGRFLVPKRYEGNPYVAKFVSLFRRVAARFNAPVIFADELHERDLPADCPFVVALKPVQWGHSDGFRGLLALPKRIRVFGLWDDIHQGLQGTKYLSRDRWVLTRFFRRCDAILCVSRDPFLRWYPRYAEKLVHFPHFFSADDFAAVRFNTDPLAQCVLSGATGKFYPLRQYAAHHTGVVVMEHPGYRSSDRQAGNALFGAAYAQELARYRCAVTCSSVIDYTVAKYFELPAAGCLLLATHTPDLHLLGFEDGVNYLRVDLSTFDGVLAGVLANPGASEGMRRAGFELARSRHSELNRADQLERLIRDRCTVPVG